MKTYRWWLSQKPRVRKKYTLLLGRYLSPKELKAWHKEKAVHNENTCDPIK